MDCPCCKKGIYLGEPAVGVHVSCLKALMKPRDEAKDEAKHVRESDVRYFITFFCEEYTARRHGAKYVPQRPKDYVLVRRLLATFDVERLKKLAIWLLETGDEWVSDTDRGIGILSAKASWLDSQLSEFEKSRRTA